MRKVFASRMVMACMALVLRAPGVLGDDSPAPATTQVLLKLQVVELSLADVKKLSGELKVFKAQEGDGNRDLQLYEPQTVADELRILLNAKAVLKVLAEPNLVTVVGRPTCYQVGGKVPVPTVQADKSVKDEYQFFGTKVDLLVTSIRDGKVAFRIRPEISQRNDGLSKEVAGAPGRTVRSMDATLEMPLGKTAVMAGLIQEQGDRKTSSTRLVSTFFLMTPYLVEVAAPATASLPKPADSP